MQHAQPMRIIKRLMIGSAFVLALLAIPALALFTNGDFEGGNFGSWDKSRYLNYGLTGGEPFTGSSIVRTAGGSDITTIVGTTGDGPQSVNDPIAGAGLKAPRFGDFAARVNSNGVSFGTGRNANSLKQSTVVVAGDVDAADGKFHVRFAYAPVLEAAGHDPDEQPYFYIALRNVTQNKLLYENFNFAEEPGVPWQTAGAYQYTDWQIVDFAPANAADIVEGDTIELEVIAAGCSLSGHGGYVYVDGFGATIPGLTVVASAPTDITAGQDLTYNITYQNGDTSAYDNTQVTFNVPPQTSFVSVSDTTSCSEAGGLVTCNFGTLNAGASGSFQVTVSVASGATGTVTAGNYAISGTGYPALLGAIVDTAVTALPGDADLGGLVPSAGALSPAFAAGTTSYSVNVPNSVATFNLTPTLSDPLATVTVNGVAVASGNASASSALVVGANTFTVVVTAQNESQQTYTVTVNRAAISTDANLSGLTLSDGALSPAFAPGTSSYTATVPSSVSSVTLTPTVADPLATVTVNGVAATSGNPSDPIALSTGTNLINVVVTAEDGSTRTYGVTITRPLSTDNNLAGLLISAGALSPAFDAGTGSYAVSVPHSVTSFTVTPTAADPTATVSVNGETIASGDSSHPIDLAVGDNVITVIVVAEDGTPRTYTITVNRAPASGASLGNLTTSAGPLSPSFAAGTTNYTVDVATGVSSINVTPTVAEAGATVRVNGVAVTSGNASGNIALSVGVNTIDVAVLSQDGATTTTYTVVVVRAGESNASLTDLAVSVGALNPAFSPGSTSYEVAVPGAVTSIAVTPTVSDPSATVKVNGVAVASGDASGPIDLEIGENTIEVVVTAQDGTTTATYTITVFRESPLINADLAVSETYKVIARSAATYTITVRNNGPDAVSGAVVQSIFPQVAAGKSWAWTCVATGGAACGAASGEGNLNTTLGALPSGGELVFTVTGELASWSFWTSTTTVSGPDNLVDATAANNSTTIGLYQLLAPIVHIR